jgi:hypothetical protein
MKTIAQFVADGIKSLPELKAALQTAMQLEFATIPPYLCAQWSIKSDPNGPVNDMIQDVVVQEMFHFALAGNMLTAIGGLPDIAKADFIPSYPTNELPGGIYQEKAVDLQPLTPDQVEVFMQIEYPQFPPVARALAKGPATIGAFYDTIAAGFNWVKPQIDPNAHAVTSGEAKPIKSIDDALSAIALIKGEGEGTEGNPDQPPQGEKTFAHYYLFKEIFTRKTLVQDAQGKWSFTGPDIPFPTWYDFKQSTVTPNPSLAFNQAVTQLMIGLQACWTSGAAPNIRAMRNLRTLGTGLIKNGIRPEFLWAASA